jgi:hypothetical protein
MHQAGVTEASLARNDIPSEVLTHCTLSSSDDRERAHARRTGASARNDLHQCMPGHNDGMLFYLNALSGDRHFIEADGT